jgi:hypothetical protein
LARVEIPAPGDLVIDALGNVLTGRSVTLKLAGTSTDATHYSALTAGTSTTGGLVTGTDGTIVDGSGVRRYVDSGVPLDMTVAGRSRRLEPRAASGETPMAYNAVGDGVTDDTTAVTAALTAAGVSGGSILIDRPYKVTSGLTMLDNVSLEFTSRGMLDFSTAPVTTTLLSATGTPGSQVALTANASAGGQTLTMASTSGFAAGDRVRIGSTAIFDPGRTNTVISEIGIVAATTSTTLTLKSPLADSYLTADTAYVQELTMRTGIALSGNGRIRGGGLTSAFTTTLTNTITAGAPTTGGTITVGSTSSAPTTGNIVIDGEVITYSAKTLTTVTVRDRAAYDTVAANHTAGATVTFGTDHTGFKASIAESVRIGDVRFEGCNAEAIGLYDTIDFVVDGARMTDSRRWGTGYGVDVVNATQDGKVVNCHFSGVRHAFTTGSSGTTGGVPRRIRVQANHLWDTVSTGDGFDTHGTGETIDFFDNDVYDCAGVGFNIECANARISRNRVWRTASHGIYCHNESGRASVYEIDANEVYNAGDMGIRVSNGATVGAGATQRRIRVADNYIYASTSRSVYVVSTDTWRFTAPMVRGNRAEGCLDANNVFQVQKTTGGEVSNNQSIGGASGSSIVRLSDVKDASVLGNGGAQGVASTGSGINATSCTDLVIGGYVFRDSSIGITLDNNCSDCVIAPGDLRGCTAPLSLGAGVRHRVIGADPIVDAQELTLAWASSDVATMGRHSIAASAGTVNSGSVYAARARCRKSQTFTQIRFFTGTTAPSGLTDVRAGVWLASTDVCRSSSRRGDRHGKPGARRPLLGAGRRRSDPARRVHAAPVQETRRVG